MGFTVVIPARLSSSRLPEKVLQSIAGEPMIVHVYRRACESDASEVWVATDDARVQQVVEAAGGRAMLTKADHRSGTDRIAELVEAIGADAGDVVVNVQGDEPEIPAEAINQVAQNLQRHAFASISTLSRPIETREELLDRSVVKVCFAASGHAHWFSRLPIPWPRDWAEENAPSAAQWSDAPHVWQRHVGIYAYRVAALRQFVACAPSTAETLESLEQLRALENGIAIHCEPSVCDIPAGIDTPADLQRAQTRMETLR